MVESVDEPPLRGLHSWAKKFRSPRALSEKDTPPSSTSQNILPQHADGTDQVHGRTQPAERRPGNETDTQQQGAHAVHNAGNGTEATAIADGQDKSPKAPIHQRFVRDAKRIITASWINWLLITVPVAIAIGIAHDWAHVGGISPSVVFAVNAVAIIPLASLLAYATESVANKLGDSWGALLNVTFGNAVEIIIFVLALVAGEVRIVQAAAVGSILSNLLLILGMAFVLGGLRFREQLFNRSVSQLSACLLSLSVISLLLPTAFHATFEDQDLANTVVLKVSRSTSVVLLLVYILYLLFQLKSHAFMYESTPQHVIDEESHPGVLAQMLDSSSSSSDDSSSTDSDSTAGSHKTANRIKRALRRRRRKSSSSTKEGNLGSFSRSETNTGVLSGSTRNNDNAVCSGDEADSERRPRGRIADPEVQTRDFEQQQDREKPQKRSKKSKKSKKSKAIEPQPEKIEMKEHFAGRTPVPSIQVGFAEDVCQIPDNTSGRPYNPRNLSSAIKPVLNSTNFPHHSQSVRTLAPPGLRAIDRASSGSRPRASSMPDFVREGSHPRAASPRPTSTHSNPYPNQQVIETVDPEIHLSITSAICLLLISTALVALCAEFLVGSIDYLVQNSGVSQAFIGLIILPMVGNAAEHVTAVTVAYRNKMDLAIGIALGSSIQIALFILPITVVLGWAISTEMSLYFSLFETMSLFASAFIVNYLMIDGRSNWLEGVLLLAAYVIIAISAFYIPTCGLSDANGIATSGAC